MLDRYITAELAIDPFEQIEVERRGHAGRIVIGGFEHADVLDPVDADQNKRPVAARGVPGAQKIDRGECAHIPERHSRKKAANRTGREFPTQYTTTGENATT